MVCHWSRMRPVLSRSGRGLGPQRRYFRRDETGLEIAGEETAFGEEARLRLGALPDRPLHRRHRVEIAVRQRLQRTDVEVARTLVLECRERSVLTENIRGRRDRKSV